MAIDLEDLKQKLVELEELPMYSETCVGLEQLSHIYGGSGIFPKEEVWPNWFKAHGVFSILTQEFVDEVYREMRRRRLDELLIVDICAGKGKLSYQLRKRGINIIPSDEYSHPMERDENFVERLNHTEALQKYRPRIVVASWIPKKPEIGDDVLHFPTVDYFIDIGETKGGATWLPQGYQNEDFVIKYLKNVARHAIGVTDYFARNQTGRIVLAQHTEVRLWKRKGAPMSINHAID